MMEIQRAKPTVVLQEKTDRRSRRVMAKYRILPDRIDRTTNMMYGVRIFDTTDLQLQRTIIADSGRMDYTEGGEDAVLTLWHGTVHHRNVAKLGEYERLDFAQQQLVLKGVGTKIERAAELAGMRSDREMNLETLMQNVHAEEDKVRAARRGSGARPRGTSRPLLDDSLAVARIGSAAALERRDSFSPRPSSPKSGTGLDSDHDSSATASQWSGVSTTASTTPPRQGATSSWSSTTRSTRYLWRLRVRADRRADRRPHAARRARLRQGDEHAALFVFYYLALTGARIWRTGGSCLRGSGMWIANIVFFAFEVAA